jgi:hypothetical protein
VRSAPSTKHAAEYERALMAQAVGAFCFCKFKNQKSVWYRDFKNQKWPMVGVFSRPKWIPAGRSYGV